jgi:hypothetical protein
MSAWLSNDLRTAHPVCLTYTHLIATRGQERLTPARLFLQRGSKVGVMCQLLAIPSEPLLSQSPNHVVVDGFMPNQA